MRAKMFRLVIFTAIILMGNNIMAQFVLKGQFRPRLEYSHGYGQLADVDQVPSVFISQRTRLDLGYRKEGLSTGLVLQDVRLWGSQRQLVGNEDQAVSVHEAWLEYAFLDGISARAGRQELVYGNHRIFGNVGWSQQGRSHDLLLLKYEREFNLHAGIAYNENADRTNNFYLVPNTYKAFQFVWFSVPVDQLDINFLFLNNGMPYFDTPGPFTATVQHISYSQTFGPALAYTYDDQTRLFFAGYFQGGRDQARNRLRAWYLNAEARKDFDGNISAQAGYEFLSGTPYDEGAVNRSFTPFYGTNHKFNGHMDYFFVGNHLNTVGLGDAYLKGVWTEGSLNFSADLHLFHAAADISPTASQYLGLELDLSAGWNVADRVAIRCGYSHLLPGASMELIKTGDQEAVHNWAWLMIDVTPAFFRSE